MTDSFVPAPLRSDARRVEPEWIDGNGHMNVAYYMLAIDRALDDVFEVLGLGPALMRERRMGPMALVNKIHYLDEMFEGEEFACDWQLLDTDHKRIHFLVTMRNLSKGTVAAIFEGLSINVDLEARRSTPYPEEIRRRLEGFHAAHAALPRPPQIGAPIGIRRG